MENNNIAEIEKNLDDKLELLSQYENLTRNLMKAEFNDVKSLLEKRQMIIEEIDVINANINVCIDNMEKYKDNIHSIISFKSDNSEDVLRGIFIRTSEIKKQLLILKEIEMDSGRHLADLSGEITEKVKQGKLNRQTVNYCNVLTGTPDKGKYFNSYS